MHLIANWMVVQLFDDLDVTEQQQQHQASGVGPLPLTTIATATPKSVASSSSQVRHKYDIQLNDLNNGNMYKFRFETLELAKHWYEKLKAATTYHERHKPDNLIRFD